MRDTGRQKSISIWMGELPSRRRSCSSVGFFRGMRLRIRIFRGRISCVMARSFPMVTIPSSRRRFTADRPPSILMGMAKNSFPTIKKAFLPAGTKASWYHPALPCRWARSLRNAAKAGFPSAVTGTPVWPTVISANQLQDHLPFLICTPFHRCGSSLVPDNKKYSSFHRVLL